MLKNNNGNNGPKQQKTLFSYFKKTNEKNSQALPPVRVSGSGDIAAISTNTSNVHKRKLFETNGNGDDDVICLDDAVVLDGSPKKSPQAISAKRSSIETSIKGEASTTMVPESVAVDSTPSVVNKQTSRYFNGSDESSQLGLLKETSSLELNSFLEVQLQTNSPFKPSPIKKSKDGFADENSRSSTNSQRSTPSKKPVINYGSNDYKLKNFRAMLDYVLKDEFHKHLFNDEDWFTIETFTSMSVPAQRLYIRLYLRKHRWLRTNKVNYPDISEDLRPIVNELIDVELLKPCSQIDDLEEALGLLDLSEIRTCMKSLKGVKWGNAKTKAEFMIAIDKHTKSNQAISSHFGGNQALSISEAILKFVKKLIDDTGYMIDENYGRLFSRMTYLYYPPQVNDDENGSLLSHEFFNALKLELGQSRYPSYKVKKESQVYRNRDDLVRYEAACRLESQILTATERKKFDYIMETLYPLAEDGFTDNTNQGHYKYDASMPYYLRNMTAGHVYTRCLNHIIPVAESLKFFAVAIDLLNKIVDQQNYCLHYKGKWYERIAIDLESHLKRPLDAYHAIQKAMDDPNVKFAPRYILYKRGKTLFAKLQKHKEHKKNKLIDICDPDLEFAKCQEKFIEAPTLQKTVQGRRTVFTNTNRSGNITVISVERAAINYYTRNDYTDGLHTEGHIYHVLLHLLFWDIIYHDELPDAFRTLHQTLPLDFTSEQFYLRRSQMIDERLSLIQSFDDDTLQDALESAWVTNHGSICLVHWDSVTIDQVKEIAVCIGVRPISAICERFCKNFRLTRSGLPDLIVWNTLTKTAKAVEVKGPNDSLSAKQILWLDYMNEWGLPAEVCYVKAESRNPLTN